MIFDCHIHMSGGGLGGDEGAGQKARDKTLFRERLNQAGIAGGVVLSVAPPAFGNTKPGRDTAKNAIDEVIAFTAGDPDLFPFFWIDPIEDGAAEQVDMAAEAGVAGFKTICAKHYPQDDRAMKIYERIAAKKLPMLFHSGILYNPGPSGEYNRPCNFEHLLFIDGLRFAMAHISWPWCDELIAVFGKWNYLVNGAKAATSELFVDLTPGTPTIYREEALRKLLTVGYAPLVDHMIFGTDALDDYDVEWVKMCVSRDALIYDKFILSAEIREKIFHKNLMAFLGK